MSIRLFATLVATAILIVPAGAQTTPKPPATTTAPAKPAVVKPAVAEDDGETTSDSVKACNAKWKIEKAKPGAKHDAKAYHQFMGNCL